MKATKTNLKECLIIEPDAFEDSRGFFLECFNIKKYSDIGITCDFVQDNHSFSKNNVLRGLHYQHNIPQGKLVRVSSGEVYDVAVDVRKGSNTFGQYASVVLSSKNKKQFWIPPGFAHGFLVLSEYADFEYKCSEFYSPENEVTIRWDDPTININWPCKNPILSEKDLSGISLSDF